MNGSALASISSLKPARSRPNLVCRMFSETPFSTQSIRYATHLLQAISKHFFSKLVKNVSPFLKRSIDALCQPFQATRINPPDLPKEAR